MVLRQSVETKGNLLSFKLQTACTYTEAATAVLNQEVLNKKKLHKHLRTLERGGVNQTASSTFDTIHLGPVVQSPISTNPGLTL